MSVSQISFFLFIFIIRYIYSNEFAFFINSESEDSPIWISILSAIIRAATALNW